MAPSHQVFEKEERIRIAVLAANRPGFFTVLSQSGRIRKSFDMVEVADSPLRECSRWDLGERDALAPDEPNWLAD